MSSLYVHRLGIDIVSNEDMPGYPFLGRWDANDRRYASSDTSPLIYSTLTGQGSAAGHPRMSFLDRTMHLLVSVLRRAVATFRTWKGADGADHGEAALSKTKPLTLTMASISAHRTTAVVSCFWRRRHRIPQESRLVEMQILSFDQAFIGCLASGDSWSASRSRSHPANS